MHRLDELMIATDGQRLRVLQGRLKRSGQFVHPHKGAFVVTTKAKIGPVGTISTE
ncbi:MAG: hypothetical protein SGJ01_08445 [Gemmatimonadota bacterium]|nr:hypothetical protein [Gemmatimonadota bacterium]